MSRSTAVPRAATTPGRTVGLSAGFVQVMGAAAIGCLALAGCASGSAAGGAASGTPTSPSGTVRVDRDFSGPIDIGNGRSMHLECSGIGSPTVLLISGTGNAGDVWREAGSATDPTHPISENDGAVFQTTARSTRVCAYDRPGTQRADGSPGGSSAVAQPTSTRDDAADIHALLAAASVPGPYVLVAHSLGGLIATTYARTFPDDVLGLVLVDPASQFMETTMGPAAWGQYVQAALSRAGTGAETIDPDASNRAVESLPALPPIPVVVLSSDQPWFILPFGVDGAMVDYSSALLDSQTLLATSLGATHITRTNSTHDIYIENAPLVNQQICTVIGHATGC
jgi:pimeloyl-ACP methyl ester carboxylesterase